MAYCLNVCGNIARALGKFDEAERHYLESYQIREGFKDPEGMAVALNHLGQIALIQNDTVRAHNYYHQSHTLYEELHDRGGLAEAQMGIGAVALKNKHYTKAQRFLREALITATDINHLAMTFTIFVYIADLFHQTGYDEKSRELLQLVRDHSASEQELREKAHRLLDEIGSHEEQSINTNRLDWETTAKTQIDFLAQSKELLLTLIQDKLIEPLTERELEVLALLAEGMSNQDIADTLTVVVGTVKAHNHSIYGKLDVKNRTEAVTRARELHLL